MTTVVVMRHGETTWNRDRRVQGWAPTRLTDRGERQSERTGEWLAGEYDVDRVHSSDLLRARETVDAVRRAVDAPVEYDEAWRERDFGVYQGLAYDDMFERFPEFGLGEDAAHAAEAVPEGGESLVDVHDRVVTAWEDLLAAADDHETRLVVAHGGSIYLLIGHVKGLDVADAVLDHDQDNCAVNEFVHEAGETRVVRENCTDWA